VGKIEWQMASQSMLIMLKQNSSMTTQFEKYIETCKNFCGPDWLDKATWIGGVSYGPKGIASRPWFLEA
jgi:hypothetical protein